MPAGPTWLSLTAAAFYALVIVSAAAAAVHARKPSAASWHVQAWVGIALFFAVLIALRVFDIENLARGDLRALLISEDSYGHRRTIQRWATAGVLLIGLGATSFWVVRRLRAAKGRRDLAVNTALAACAAMLGLVALRLISLHSTDALLYGPLKLNWIGDLGLGFTVGAAALSYVKIARSRR